MERTKNVSNYRTYADDALAGRYVISSTEKLTAEMKRGERIVLALRTRRGIASTELDSWPDARREFQELGLLREINGRQVLTPKGKLVADSVAEAFI